MATELDEKFMRLAIAQARLGERLPGAGEVGAVLTHNGRAVCVAFNEGELQSDPTADAEIVAIRRACGRLKTTALRGFTLYCTLQPCGMCTIACLWAGISRIVYGATRDAVNAVISNHGTATRSTLSVSHSEMIFRSREKFCWPNALLCMQAKTRTCRIRGILLIYRNHQHKNLHMRYGERQRARVTYSQKSSFDLSNLKAAACETNRISISARV